MIHVQVRILGPLRKPDGRDQLTVDLEEDSTLRDLLAAMRYPEAQLRFIVTVVNGTQERMNHRLRDGDAVDLLVPASGG